MLLDTRLQSCCERLALRRAGTDVRCGTTLPARPQQLRVGWLFAAIVVCHVDFELQPIHAAIASSTAFWRSFVAVTMNCRLVVRVFGPGEYDKHGVQVIATLFASRIGARNMGRKIAFGIDAFPLPLLRYVSVVDRLKANRLQIRVRLPEGRYGTEKWSSGHLACAFSRHPTYSVLSLMPRGKEFRQYPLSGIGDKPVLSLVEGTGWTKPLSGIYPFAMGIVKGESDGDGSKKLASGRLWPQGRPASRGFLVGC